MKTEKTSQTITNSTKAARPQDREPMSVKSLVEDTVGLPYHDVCFMMGKEIRDRGDRVVLEAYVKSKITSDQCYQPSKRKIVKPAKIWSEIKSSKQPLQPKEWTFTPTSVEHVTRAKDSTSRFRFGNGSRCKHQTQLINIYVWSC